MSQYLMSVLDTTTGTPEDTPRMAAIGAFNKQLQADGHWVFANGLAEPSTATVVDGRDGEPVFTDGPFLESKEYIVGFWVIEVPDHDVALTLAAEASRVCEQRVELRRFQEL